MAAPKGNTYWKLAKGFAIGAQRKYTPEELWQKALDYFDWIEKNPLKEEKVFGTGVRMKVNKMRAMTLTGFYTFADIDQKTFEKYCKEDAYILFATRIKNIIFTQKFEGAAADLLNPNIIAREIGLADKTDITSGGKPVFSSVNVKVVRTKEDLNE